MDGTLEEEFLSKLLEKKIKFEIVEPKTMTKEEFEQILDNHFAKVIKELGKILYVIKKSKMDEYVRVFEENQYLKQQYQTREIGKNNEIGFWKWWDKK